MADIKYPKSSTEVKDAPPNRKKRRPRRHKDSKVPLPEVDPKIDPRENPRVDSLNSLPVIVPVDKLKEDLRKKLRETINDKKLGRMTVKNRTDVLDSSMNAMGVDMSKLKEDIEALQKQGGFTLNLKN